MKRGRLDMEARVQEQMHKAISAGQNDVLRVLLEIGADANACDASGQLPLVAAGSTGKVDVLRLLHDIGGADFNKRRRNGSSVGSAVVMAAATQGHAEVLRVIHDDLGVNIVALEKGENCDAIIAASENGHVEAVQQLIAIGIDVCRPRDEKVTLLHVAAEHGHAQVLPILCEAGISVNCRKSSGVTPLFFAAQNGHTSCAQVLLDLGADLESVRIEDLMTPLLIASVNGHADTVDMLCYCGADVNARTSQGLTAIYFAAQNGYMSTLETLHMYGADYNLAGLNGQLPLFIACEMGQLEVIRFFHGVGLDLNQIHKRSVYQGASCLYLAAEMGHTQAVCLLIELGADPSIKANDDVSTMFIACENGHLGVVKALFAIGVSALERTTDGFNPLLVACQNGHIDIVRFFCSEGVEVLHPNYDGVTPTMMALQNGHTALHKLLKKTAAKQQAKFEANLAAQRPTAGDALALTPNAIVDSSFLSSASPSSSSSSFPVRAAAAAAPTQVETAAAAKAVKRPKKAVEATKVLAPFTEGAADFSLNAVIASGLCVICREEQSNFVAYPCGHQCGCGPCLTKIFRSTKLCPVCRKKMKSRPIKVFSAGTGTSLSTPQPTASISTSISTSSTSTKSLVPLTVGLQVKVLPTADTAKRAKQYIHKTGIIHETPGLNWFRVLFADGFIISFRPDSFELVGHNNSIAAQTGDVTSSTVVAAAAAAAATTTTTSVLPESVNSMTPSPPAKELLV